MVDAGGLHMSSKERDARASRDRPTVSLRDQSTASLHQTAAPTAVGSEPAAPRIALPAIDVAHYAIGDVISAGGMGQIRLAQDRRLDRRVAIKEVLDDDRARLQRFEREARITARLQHPSIVAVHEAGRWPDGRPFYAMPFIEGRSLHDVLRDARTLDARLALVPHVLAIADAIAYAHDRRIIHRDLKPKNVMIGPFGETIVIDWGIAKALPADASAASDDAPDAASSDATNDATSGGEVLGTPAYMPPEQAAQPASDPRADVYAIGAILYHVLAGAPPYRGATSAEVLAALRAGPPAPLSQRAPRAPADLVAIVDKAMAREPAARYATAQHLADDLRRYQTGLLVGAHRYTVGQLARRFLRRNRVAVTVAAVLVGVLIAISIYGVRRIVDERDLAVRERNLAREQRVASERLVSFALGDVRDELLKVGRLALLQGIAGEVDHYYRDLGASDAEGRRRRAQALQLLGDVAWAKADRAGAAARYREAIALDAPLVVELPARGAYALGRDRARLGQAIEDSDRPAAAAEYAIAEALLRPLAAAGDREARTELGTMLIRVGNGARARGDLDGALATYRESVALREALQDRATPTEKLSFTEALDRTASALQLQHAFPEALALLRRSHAVRAALVDEDPDNTERIAALQVTSLRLAGALNASGARDDAEQMQRAGIELSRRLARREPNNMQWRDSLYVGLSILGQIYLDKQALDAAEAAFVESRQILGELVAKDPTHVRRKRNLAIAENKLGLARKARGDFAGALAHYRAAIQIEDALVAADASDIDSFDLRSADQQNVGVTLLRLGDVAGAIAILRTRVAGQEQLAAKDPNRAEWQQGRVEALASLYAALRRQPSAASEAQAVRTRARALLAELRAAGKLDADGEKIAKELE